MEKWNEVLPIALITLIPFIVAFSFFVFIYYRQKREALFRQQVAEVEMKALRAQMNPHFIFNSLNSIYRYMEQNDLQNAGAYLVKFSNLIRMILENSLHKEVPLSDDMNALELYIQMEQLRMGHKFTYVVNIASSVNPEDNFVPPMIIQPFVENSIWHGLNNKPGEGALTISVSRENNMLKYLIEDNGEEKKTAPQKTLSTAKKKSLGMSLTRERLEMLNKTKNVKANFKISDIRDESNTYKGKRVELWIPVES